MASRLRPVASPLRGGLWALISLVTLAVSVGGMRSARAEGAGLKLSDSLVLHLGASLGGGLDTNPFYASGDSSGCQSGNANTCQPAYPSAYLAFRPTLDIASLSAQRGGDAAPRSYDFRLHAGLPLRFLVTNNPEFNNHYSVGGELGLTLRINPAGVFGFDLFENFARTSSLPYSVASGTSQGSQANNVNNDQNSVGLRLAYRPGGGRLEIALQYAFGVNYYEPQSVYISRSYLSNDINLRVRWSFFPKTAIYINAQETTYTYFMGNQPGSTVPAPDSYPFRVVAGIIGLITPRFSVNANIGYGNSFTQSSMYFAKDKITSYNGAVGLIDLEWRPTQTTILNLGYRHDLAPAVIGTDAETDGAGIGIAQQIWRIVGTLRFNYDRRQYRNINTMAENQTAGRTDNVFNLHVDLSLPIRDWVSIAVGNDLVIDKTFNTCTLLGGSRCDYTRNDTWLSLTFAY